MLYDFSKELTDAGIPRFPTYVGIKADGQWPPDPETQPKLSKIQQEKLAKMQKVEEENSEEEAPKKKEQKKEKEEKPAPKKKVDKGEKLEKEVSVEGNGKGGPLGGIIFSVTGTHSVGRKQLIEIIEQNGGVFHKGVTKKVTYLVATDTEVAVGTKKVNTIPMIANWFRFKVRESGALLWFPKTF